MYEIAGPPTIISAAVISNPLSVMFALILRLASETADMGLTTAQSRKLRQPSAEDVF